MSNNGGASAGPVQKKRQQRLHAAMNSLNKSMSLRQEEDDDGGGGSTTTNSTTGLAARGDRSRVGGAGGEDGRNQPLLMNDVRSVRRAALTVMSPLVYTWLVISAAASIFLLLLLCNLLDFMPLSYAMVLLPLWLAHGALFFCHILSARALSRFIARANENRQRMDASDHIDRTEYLPLLQRALKFGLKTAFLSLCMLIFEILMYIKIEEELDNNSGSRRISLASALVPIWPIVLGLLIDGIICKTQHILRVFVWVLLASSMILATLKVDYDATFVSWGLVLLPLLGVILVCVLALSYIVYGHRVGYFRLTSSQLVAGWLYSISAGIALILLVFLVEADGRSDGDNLLEWNRTVRLFIISAAPVSVSMFGVGAWAVAKDEFNRLLTLGGQAAVIPMKLKLEPHGWTSVKSVGVAMIPMFGEVSFEPLDSSKADLEMCGACCACYPYDDEEEVVPEISTQISNRIA